MVPCSGGGADAEVDKESGTCSSVSLVLRYAAPQTARPATFIATLRCETVSEQVRHTTFVTVPPRYGFAVIKPGRYSYKPQPG